ncbi:MAG: metallophosphoesterase [Spirochaetes bacterium]|nr:metallophosphoesterase [Spirochaetota bacterium]
MIYITGDTHGGVHTSKLNRKNFREQKTLTKNDFVIVAGDFGVVWTNGREQDYWLNWFEEKPFTTLFVDGNHENFDLLNCYTVTQWNGGKIRKISGSVIQLMRGQVYFLDGQKIFTFGGGQSQDKAYRVEGRSWWKEEMPSKEEYEEGLENLKANAWNVDYVVTHTPTSSVIKHMRMKHRDKVYNTENELSDYLEEISRKIEFKKWFSGHLHLDDTAFDKFCAVFEGKQPIGEAAAPLAGRRLFF